MCRKLTIFPQLEKIKDVYEQIYHANQTNPGTQNEQKWFLHEFLDLESVEDHMITLGNRFKFEDGQISFLGESLVLSHKLPEINESAPTIILIKGFC